MDPNSSHYRSVSRPKRIAMANCNYLQTKKELIENKDGPMRINLNTRNYRY